jgi:hypothetical protein
MEEKEHSCLKRKQERPTGGKWHNKEAYGAMMETRDSC